MTPIDIKDLLPDPDSGNYERIKKEHPYNILLKYAKAIEEKYPQKLTGVITEAVGQEGNFLVFAFYIMAHIGKGYSYRLLELEGTTPEIYPLKIKVFEKNTQELKTVSSSQELESVMQDVLRFGFTQTLLLNLISQVDLYNQFRNEKFDWEDDLLKGSK